MREREECDGFFFHILPSFIFSLPSLQIASERDELKERVCALEIAKDKAFRARDDLEKELELSKMQSSQATHNEVEQVQQLADQVRSAMVEKEKLQEELDEYRGKISALEMEVARGSDDLAARAKDLEGLHAEITSLKSAAATQQEKYDSDVKGVKARLADIMTENMDLKEKVYASQMMFYFLPFIF